MTSTLNPRLLIIGDSLSFHRPQFGQRLEQCWPLRLKERLPDADIWVHARPGILVNKILEEFALFEDSLYLFNIIIIQSGINDSCPRPMPYFLHRFFGWLGSQKLKKFINRNYKTLLKFYTRCWTSESDYRDQLTSLLSRSEKANPSTRVLLVPILPACKGLAEKVPSAPASVVRYNEIIRSVCEKSTNGIFLSDFAAVLTADLIIEDGHHLNEQGHNLLAEHVVRVIEKNSPSPRMPSGNLDRTNS